MVEFFYVFFIIIKLKIKENNFLDFCNPNLIKLFSIVSTEQQKKLPKV